MEWQVIIWWYINLTSRDPGQLAKSTVGFCPPHPLPISQLPDRFHHSPFGQMLCPFVGCLICCWSAFSLPSLLIEQLELALHLPGYSGAHLVFGISSRWMGQNGQFTFARNSRLLVFHSNVKQTSVSTTWISRKTAVPTPKPHQILLKTKQHRNSLFILSNTLDYLKLSKSFFEIV